MSAPSRETPSKELVPAGKPGELDANDPRLTQFDLVREGARRDGIEIVHYETRWPPGSRAERRVERSIAFLFLLSGAAGTAFVVAYLWPWGYEAGATPDDPLYTPILGFTLGLALFALGAGIVAWVRKLMPHEIAIEEHPHAGGSRGDQRIAGAILGNALNDSSLPRRPLLKGAVALGLAPLGIVALAPLVGGLIKNPHTSPDERVGLSPQDYTGWHPALNDGNPIRLVHEDGRPIGPADVSVGGQVTVFPGIPGGSSNELADSPTLLIHLREEHAQELRENLYELNQGSMAGNFVAYSKICTHAGCPPSLFEQQTNKLLCPCHQSQFLITDNAKPVFGPAARSLAMLPIGQDDEGFFVATADYKVPVGPSFWER